MEAWCSWLAGLDCSPCWMPATMGATVGGLYAALNRAGMRRFWRAPNTQLNVVITGGGRGIGKAIAREFLRSNSTKPPAPFLTKSMDLNVLVLPCHCGQLGQMHRIITKYSKVSSSCLVLSAKARLIWNTLWDVTSSWLSYSYCPILQMPKVHLKQGCMNRCVHAGLETGCSSRLVQHQASTKWLLTCEQRQANFPLPTVLDFAPTCMYRCLVSTMEMHLSVLPVTVAPVSKTAKLVCQCHQSITSCRRLLPIQPPSMTLLC